MNLHFAIKLFTAVSNFLGHCMCVPAPYKPTKNQINATTDITAGSCYRVVHWNSKVSTNGQNPTFSHLSARSQLRNRQWLSSSPCVAGHRPVREMSYLGHRTLNESDWLPVPELSWKRRSRTRDEKKCCMSISECMWRMHDRNGDGFLSELVKFEGIGGEYQTSAGIEVVYIRFSIEYPTEWPFSFGDFMWGFS